MSPRIAPTLGPNKTRTNRQVRAQIIDAIRDCYKDHFIITFAVNKNNNLRVWTRQTGSLAVSNDGG